MSNNAARQFAGLFMQAQAYGRKPITRTYTGPNNQATLAKGRDRRDAMIAFIEVYQAEHGYPPSIRDIGDSVGLCSSSTVWSHLKRLERDGRILRDPNKPRCIELTHPKPSEADRLRAIFERLRAEMSDEFLKRKPRQLMGSVELQDTLSDLDALLKFAIVEAIGE